MQTLSLWFLLLVFFFSSNNVALSSETTVDLPLPHAELASGKVVEAFSGRAGTDVSRGSELIGLLLGKNLSITDFANLKLVSPRIGGDRAICIKVTTRDGLFWSDNPFMTPKEEADEITAGPVAKQYIEELQKYPKEDIMVRASVPSNNDCSDYNNPKMILPALGTRDGYLRAYLLTHGRAASVKIWDENNPKKYSESVRCERLSPGSRVAVDRVCKLKFTSEERSGKYQLWIRIRERLGGYTDSRYVLELPGIN